MRNIFLFIRRYFHFLVFLTLQIICIYFITQYSSYHQAAFGNIRNEVTGNLSKHYSGITSYFNLKQQNENIMKANETLLNKLPSSFELMDTARHSVTDSLGIDSTLLRRRYSYFSCNVVYNNIASQNNFLLLAPGKNQQVRKGMGIIDPSTGVVGITTEVSDDYAVVMSLLHRDSRISGKLLKKGETGIVSWDGKEPNIVTMSNISKSAKISKGDTVVTSGFSTAFPKGMLIGTVKSVYTEEGSNSYKIKVRTATDFHNLERVFIIEDARQEDIENILEKTNKQN